MNRARDHHDDEISAAFADSVSSSFLSTPAPGNSTVLGSLVGGRYRVHRLRGEGGMGRVYEAEHIEIGKRVALKILHPGYSQTPDLVERLRREARAASCIGHPNVVDVTDSGTTDDGAFYFVMEYLEGRELGEIIFEEKGLDVRRSIGITIQICRALQAAHKAGVIHRDLKPENVLLVERDGQKDFVKVLDFGIAKNVTDQEDEANGNPRRKLTNPGVAMGTPEYMAPEQAAGRPADVRSDVYAVGGLLYEMLSGRAAYEGSSFIEILHKKATQVPAPISSFRKGIPAEIEDLVKRTMAMDPAARPQTMEDFERELNEIAWNCLPAIPNERMVTPRSTASLQGVRGGGHTVWGPGAMGTVGALWDRLATDRRRLSAIGAAAFVVVSLAVFGISRSRANLDRGNRSMAAETMLGGPSKVPSTWISQPPMVPVGVTEAAPEVKATATAQDELGVNAGAPVVEKEEAAGLGAGESDVEAKASVTASPPRARAGGVVGLSAVDAKKMLTEGEQLLRAQRFTEAREVFTKLIKSKPTRGRALVALAEIAFQEKNYEETIRSAKLAADRGGGVRARVLLGDAHFRLSHFQDAATAYVQALRVEPENPIAKYGLALASKRM
ncbi:MAG: protein kinase [Deltaproteobacteria bacterium]|nr:protein kinase [Deltaproteobacteria bacterium]